jgi:FixJ family two-component response regulator
MELEQEVAILDDDLVSCMMLAHALQSGGLTTRCFSVPEEFLEYMKTHRPKCVLLDMNMPGMNGLDVQVQLREMGSTSPVIFVTAEADVATAQAVFHNGASNFIPKPINPSEVLRLIREAA